MLKKFASRHGLCRVKRETCRRRDTDRLDFHLISPISLVQPAWLGYPAGSCPVDPRHADAWDFRRAGIVLPQSLATDGWARLAVLTRPLTLPPGPCYSRARSGQGFTPQAGCGMKAGSSAKRSSPTPSAAHSVTAKRKTKTSSQGKSARLFVVTSSGSARPCWRRRSRASPIRTVRRRSRISVIRRLRRSSRTFRCVSVSASNG